METKKQIRNGSRVLWTSNVTDRVISGHVVSARRKRGEVLVQADEGACYWRRPESLLVVA